MVDFLPEFHTIYRDLFIFLSYLYSINLFNGNYSEEFNGNYFEERGGVCGNYAYCAFEIYPFSLRGGEMKNSIQVYLKSISRKLSV